jgi:Alpha/beta hydrolase
VTGPGSSAAVAIGQAAVAMGLPNPMEVADEILQVEVDALQEWFTVAARIRVLLWQGAERIADAIPVLAAGWSRPEPHAAIGRQREAGLAGRDIISRQVDAADEAVATLRQSRLLADSELSAAESAALGLGWIPPEDLLGWAIGHQALGPVAGIVGTLQQRLNDLLARNTDALNVLAMTLRSDPGDPIEQLVAPRPTTAVGSMIPVDPDPRTGAAPVGATGIDADNLSRLTADLQSTDIAVLAMALGVQQGLQEAAEQGGVAQLLVYESANSTSQGRAAISVGDVTTADNVAVFAPGVSSAPVTIAQGIAGAAGIRDESQRQAPGDRTAVVAWYGYDIPLSAIGGVPQTPLATTKNLVAALDDGAARDGGALMVDDLARFRQWAPDTARFIGMGFSMGSTTVSAAAAQGAEFDDLILLGSPGASTQVETAGDYPGMSADHVHALSYDNDPITTAETDLLAGGANIVPRFTMSDEPFGPDPANRDFGAQVIDTTSNNPDLSISVNTGAVGGFLTDALASKLAGDVGDLMIHHQESNYLSGRSLEAVAAVVNGRYSEVPIKPGR